MFGDFFYIFGTNTATMKTTLILLCLLLPVICFAQDRKSLEERALEFYNYSVKQEYDSLVDCLHSSNFKSVTRNDFKTFLSKKLVSDEVTISPINTPPNFYFGEIKKIGETYYCIYYTDQTMKATFSHELSGQHSNYLIEYVKKRFATDKVVFNSRMNAILLLHRIKDVAIADKENNYIWTFSPQIADRAVIEQLGL